MTVLELDIREAKGGDLMVLHDATVDRTTNGTGTANALTSQQLVQLDAGYNWTRSRKNHFPYRGKGLTIPYLYQILKAFPQTRLNIDIKDKTMTAASTLCKLLKAFSMNKRVLVASFHDEVLNAFRLACPGTATAATPDEIRTFMILTGLGLERFFSSPATAIQVPEKKGGLRIVTPRLIRAAHNRNLRVDVWTINQPDRMRRLLELGVDGIMTDRPDLLMQIMDAITLP